MFFNSGSVYDGEWKGDLRSEYGREMFSNKDLYEGTFQNDKFHGKGVFKWNDGEAYDGDWVNGVREGFGVWKNVRGDVYKGEWKADKFNGKGHLLSSNGIYLIFFLN